MHPELQKQFTTPSHGLEYRREVRHGALIIFCQGAFSLANHVLLDDVVAEFKKAKERRVLLDLSGVVYMDSVGVGSLAMIVKHTMTAGIEFALISNDVVDPVLEMASLDRVFRVARSVEEVLGKAAT